MWQLKYDVKVLCTGECANFVGGGKLYYPGGMVFEAETWIKIEPNVPISGNMLSRQRDLLFGLVLKYKLGASVKQSRGQNLTHEGK